MQKCFNGILLIPFFIFSFSLSAQQNSVSPYSRLGLGDRQPQNYTRGLGMGGATLGLKDALNINFSNPASYSQLGLTTFEIGLQYSFIEQKQLNPDITLNNTTSGLRYFAVAVPLTDWWGSALGIQPYSYKGYDIRTSRVATPDNIAVRDSFTGNGGLSQVYWGNAFEVAEGLSLGLNTTYIFGGLAEETTIRWAGNIYNSRMEETARINGFRFMAGLQYTYELANNKELSAGLTFANKSGINANVDKYAFVFTDNGMPIDSLSSITGYETEVTLPNEFGFGLTYGKKTEQSLNYAWLLAADIELYRGSEFVDHNEKSELMDAYRMEVGGYIVPTLSFENLSRSNSYFGLMEYRLGAYYEKTPYAIDGQQLNDYGITFGFGLPVRQKGLAPGEVKSSIINTGLILGRRGTLDNGLIQESYLNIYLGITLNDKWFIKYKYR